MLIVRWMSACAVAMIAGGLGCSPQDEEEIAKALADRLSDKITFNNSTAQDGAPPTGHPMDAAYPQISTMDVPFSLTAESPINLVLHSSFANPTNGAIVWVRQANVEDTATKYLHVVEPLVFATTEYLMTLIGQLLDDPELLGSAFSVLLGIRDSATSEVGNYAEWNFSIPGGEGKQCRCADPGVVLEPNPCDWPDANTCAGWTSVVLGSAGNYSMENEQATQQTLFPDGTQYTVSYVDQSCTIRIRCP